MKKLIQIQNIVKTFDNQVVLKGINLDIGDYDFSYAGTNKTDIVNKWNDLTTK